MEDQPSCDNLSLVIEYGNENNKVYSLSRNELFEETGCLMPCVFMEYRVSFVNLFQENENN